jgi:drug/metabolite transporter (DMT)-like permease
MLSASLIFACCTFALKLIPADMFDIMIGRFFVQSVGFGAFAAFYKRYNVFNTNGQPIACALNIFMSSSTNLTYFGAFYFLPLSDLNTIKYTYIVWAAILSVIFLKDRFKIINGISFFFTCIGLILATKPHFFIKIFTHLFHPSSTIVANTTASTITTTIATAVTAATTSPYYYLGIGLASVSALAKAIQMIARKQLVKTKQPYSVMNFQFTIVGLLVSIIYSIIRRFWQPEPYPWKWMGTAGVFFGCVQLLTNTFAAKALKRENVQLISILGSLDIIYAVILQYIFFRQTKSWIFYVGASLIVLSAVIVSLESHWANKRDRKHQAIDDKNHEINYKI